MVGMWSIVTPPLACAAVGPGGTSDTGAQPQASAQAEDSGAVGGAEDWCAGMFIPIVKTLEPLQGQAPRSGDGNTRDHAYTGVMA